MGIYYYLLPDCSSQRKLKEDLVSMVAEITTVKLVKRSFVKLLNTAAMVTKVTIATI
jgi:hypothetical protein